MSLSKVEILSILTVILIAGGSVYASVTHDVFIIEDYSMFPAYESGDRIIAKKFYKTDNNSDLVNKIVIFCHPFSGTSEINPDPDFLLVKRCVAGPGDSLRIDSGVMMNSRVGMSRHHSTPISGHYQVETWYYAAITNSIDGQKGDILNMPWIYIPKKGDTVSLKSKEVRLYSKIIEYENKKGNLSLNGLHKFNRNYYFLCGDNTLHSFDSRVWGFVPEEFILYIK